MRTVYRILRSYARRPLIPMVAVGILSLGLAGAVSTFAYVASFRASFPGVDADGLVRVFASDDEEPYLTLSYLDFLDLKESSSELESLGAVAPYFAATVRLRDATDVVYIEPISGAYFEVLGLEPAAGRLLGPEDNVEGSDPAAVISHDYWMSRYGGDLSALGQTIYLNYLPYTVVGVTPPAFVASVPDFPASVFVPNVHFRARYTNWDIRALDRDVPLVRVLGRMAEGATLESVNQELAALARGLDETYPRADSRRTIRAEPATWIEPQVRAEEASVSRTMVFATIGFLILVCANVSTLLLALLSNQRRWLALKAAVGATPRQIAGEVFVRNLILSLLATVPALLVAIPVCQRLGSYFSTPTVWGETPPRVLTIGPETVVFALIVAVITGLVAAALPGLEARTLRVHEVLKAQRGGSTGVRLFGLPRLGAKELMVAAQVSIAVVLLVTCGLVISTFGVARDVDPGFHYESVLASYISTSSTGLQPEGREAYFLELERRLEEEPWVKAATLSANAPLSGHGVIQVGLEGGTDRVRHLYEAVHVGFFEKMGIPIEAGRTISPADTAGAEQVVVLNRPAARALFGDNDPLGRTILFPTEEGEDIPVQVVGLVGDVKLSEFLAPAEPAAFFPYAQRSYRSGSALMVDIRGSPRETVTRLQEWLRDYEPHIAIVNILPYQEVVNGALFTQRMNAEVFTALAVLGLLLACAGTFGVVTLSVASRTREIGLRKAIGATSGSLNRFLVHQALVPVALGGITGVLIAALSAPLIQALLYGVEPVSIVFYIGGVGVLLLASAAAALGPTARASRVDPMTALRAE